MHGRSHRVSRVKPGAATSELGGTFIFIINEDQQRQQHLTYTLNHFLQPQDLSLSEAQLVKRYAEL